MFVTRPPTSDHQKLGDAKINVIDTRTLSSYNFSIDSNMSKNFEALKLPASGGSLALLATGFVQMVRL